MGRDIRPAYVPGATAATGSGQSVALVEMSGKYLQADISSYESANQLPSPHPGLVTVSIDGYVGVPNDNGSEVALDIEMAIAMAPNLSTVFVYEGFFTDPAADILNRIATDDTSGQVSSCFNFRSTKATDQICQQFAAQGQSFFQASGDGGAFNFATKGTNIEVSIDPMEEPWATAVGGTDLTMSGGQWSSETAWHWSGGGYGDDTNLISSSIPWWQAGVPNQYNQASTTWRNFPDVALLATNVAVIVDSLWTYMSGTSAAAPLWAGFTALVNGQAAQHRFPPVGFLNPALYAIGQGRTTPVVSTRSPAATIPTNGRRICSWPAQAQRTTFALAGARRWERT